MAATSLPNSASLLVELENEVAAIFRQYRRASDAHDAVALAMEADAIGCRIARMLYPHLDARIGISSGNWVWADGHDECNVVVEETQMMVSGRLFCSLPKGRPREWTEPFSARFVHNDQSRRLADYTLYWGTRATLLDVRKVERLIHHSEERFDPPPPTNLEEWAYVFRKGEVAEPARVEA